MKVYTEEFQTDENGSRLRILRKNGEICSVSAADDEQLAQAIVTANNADAEERAEQKRNREDLLKIDPSTATTEDIVKLLQFLVQKSV